MIGIKAEKLAAKGRCPPLCVRPWIVGSQTPSSPSSPPPLLAFLSWSPIPLLSAPQISSTVESQALRLKPEASILNLLDYWHLWIKFTGFCQTKFDTISKSFPYFGQPGGYKCSHSFHNCLHRSQMVNVLFGENFTLDGSTFSFQSCLCWSQMINVPASDCSSWHRPTRMPK